MPEDNQAFVVNTDGSADLTIEGKKVRFVKESDLGAVKSALKDRETELSTTQANLATANSKYDTEHQVVLQERVAKEQLEKDAKEGTTLKTKVVELETEVADLKKVGGEINTKLTEQLRTTLKTTYKIEEAKLEGKALTELENIHNALQLTGVAPAAANYDGKGGGDGAGSDLAGKTPLQLAALGYELSEKK